MLLKSLINYVTLPEFRDKYQEIEWAIDVMKRRINSLEKQTASIFLVSDINMRLKEVEATLASLSAALTPKKEVPVKCLTCGK
jgi:paraquat-inducible protein B